ncbi:MAG: hypothetical protein Kow0037_24720 [Calditrichia bacterium]
MNIIEEKRNDVIVVKLEGNLIGGPEAVVLNDTVNRYLDEKSLKLVFDLANVERMNSSGLGLLIKAMTTFKTNGGELKLANVNAKISKLLVITRLDHVFETYDSVDSAINSF